jgi:hypothetical protein
LRRPAPQRLDRRLPNAVFSEFFVQQQGALQDFESFIEAAHRP